LARLRPIGHEDRLSLVEHLDELRGRLIACSAVFVVAFAVCYWQNAWLLDTVNRPLYASQHVDDERHSQNPLGESARFQIASGRAARATSEALVSVDALFKRLESGRGVSPADARAL